MAKETPNHSYQRPDRGTKDWHIPLNENFSRIDTEVEIKDTAENLEQYQPKEGAKFLATDSRRTYIGNGEEWLEFGSVAGRARSVSLGENAKRATVMSDGTFIAQPGQLQDVIDTASTGSEFGQAPAQTVKMVSGETYEVSETVRLKRGVRLECNGAKVVPTGDFNVFELARDTVLIDPFVDTRGKSWSSTQVVIGPQNAQKLDTANRAWVKDAYLLGDAGKGIGIQFRGGSKPCSMQVANGTLDGFDRAVDFYAAGENRDPQGDWSNGNQFWGRMQDFRIGISMRSDGAEVSGNTVRVQAQPEPEVSEWLWKMEDDPRESRDDDKFVMKGNTIMAYPWDVSSFTQNNSYYSESDRDAPFWFLGRGRRYGNSLLDMSGVRGNQYVLNNSDTPDRNGIFTAHGGFVVGTTEFETKPAYQQNDSRNWHPQSRNETE
ncbi:hypothetical protein [Haloarcula argentinensis]|uniref:Uncharacterized protein n=1 Tax=Haloarcula argentinensis TaxID=43776 RepID=A0ABU2F481_HALAR|nr:hypothetical protein [Haloarcula argentinensis]EMA26540.1 hypothetical protein C443_02302 [Haloarcula argentinensis DSM 12282]MDS0255380.1 hypothetical protein [Haloarcula argentinensis]